MHGGLGVEGDSYHIVNLSEDSGEHDSVDETTTKAIFVAPAPCEILDIGLAVTTAVTAHTSNHWTISVTNQTGDVALLSSNFSTDSDLTGNGGRALTADTLNSLCLNSTGTQYLQNAVLAKGDVLLLTATRGASGTALAYPVIVVKYRL